MAFMHFVGPKGTATIHHVYTDNAKEFAKAMKDLKLLHDKSTPYRPQTNGVAERAVKRVKEGTAAVLLQSRLVDDWWREAAECFCFCEQHNRRFGGRTDTLRKTIWHQVLCTINAFWMSREIQSIFTEGPRKVP